MVFFGNVTNEITSWVRIAVVGERRSYADLGEMSTVGLFTGFESDGVESVEFFLIRCVDDRSV